MPATPAAATITSDEVARSWEGFAAELLRAERLPGSSATGWHPKCFRVRAWALKQEMRDGAIAPFVRWIGANEAKEDRERMRAVEVDFVRRAAANRARIEAAVTESVSAAIVPARVSAFPAAEIPFAISRPPVDGSNKDWPGAARVGAVPWVYPAEARESGKYDEPMRAAPIAAPDPADLSAVWWAAWDEEALHVRVIVNDDIHLQTQPPERLAREDSIQLALKPDRGEFPGARHSWYYHPSQPRVEGEGAGLLLEGQRRRARREADPHRAGGEPAGPLAHPTSLVLQCLLIH